MPASATRVKYALISRTFWPVNPAIGEALLLAAEQLSERGGSLVIAQASTGLREKLAQAGRGRNVRLSLMRSMTTSASAMPLRVFELLLFTCFVFFSLCYHRPARVYVATNPPLLVPMVVRWYCRLFRREYVYHLQDIHPEATTVVTGKSSWITRLLQRIDCTTVAKADVVITLTRQMQDYLQHRMGTDAVLPVVLLDNPSVQGEVVDEPVEPVEREPGFVYCGNAGRLQRIPLLLQAIETYLQRGGTLPFVFAGGGVYAGAIQELARKFDKVTYLGVLPAEQAALLMQRYGYGLMPIDDEVTRYAFPSKSSSYVFSGCRVLAICGADTGVAEWVSDSKLGQVVEPNMDSIVSCFFALEQQPMEKLAVDEAFLQRLTPLAHAEALVGILTGSQELAC